MTKTNRSSSPLAASSPSAPAGAAASVRSPRARILRASFAAVLGAIAIAPFAMTPEVHAAKPANADPPTVPTLATMLETFHWGMNHMDVIKQHNQPGGIIDKDYDPALMHAQPGVQQKAIENDRDNHKAAFAGSYIEFGNTPTGYDTTEINGEYTYKNKEALLYIERAGKKRYFFFIGDRLWKILDEVALKPDGALGASFADATNKTNNAVGVMGRLHPMDPDNGYAEQTVEWQDATSHLRLIDFGRSAGLAIEDRATLQNLSMLRANKVDDPLAIDPSITAVTQGNLSDPNAAPPAPSASAKPTKKKTH